MRNTAGTLGPTATNTLHVRFSSFIKKIINICVTKSKLEQVRLVVCTYLHIPVVVPLLGMGLPRSGIMTVVPVIPFSCRSSNMVFLLRLSSFCSSLWLGVRSCAMYTFLGVRSYSSLCVWRFEIILLLLRSVISTRRRPCLWAWCLLFQRVDVQVCGPGVCYFNA